MMSITPRYKILISVLSLLPNRKGWGLLYHISSGDNLTKRRLSPPILPPKAWRDVCSFYSSHTTVWRSRCVRMSKSITHLRTGGFVFPTPLRPKKKKGRFGPAVKLHYKKKSFYVCKGVIFCLFWQIHTHTPDPLRIVKFQAKQDHLSNSGFGLLHSVPTVSKSSSWTKEANALHSSWLVESSEGRVTKVLAGNWRRKTTSHELNSKGKLKSLRGKS